jgi:hypothetical protein
LLVGGYPSRTEEATVQIEDRLARFVCELQVADVPASAQRAMRQGHGGRRHRELVAGRPTNLVEGAY